MRRQRFQANQIHWQSLLRRDRRQLGLSQQSHRLQQSRTGQALHAEVEIGIETKARLQGRSEQPNSLDLGPAGPEQFSRALSLQLCPTATLGDRPGLRFTPLLPVAPMGC